MNLSAAQGPSSAKRRWIQIVWKILGPVATLAALYFLASRVVGNGQQILRDVQQMAALPLIGALLLTLLMLILMPLGWSLALRANHQPIRFRLAFMIYYRVSIFRYLPGSIWNFPGRAFLCQEQGIPLTAFARSTFLELYFLLVIAAALAGCGIALSSGNMLLLGLTLILTGLLLVAITWLFPWLTAVIKRITKWDLTQGGNLQKRSLIVLAIIYLAVWISYGLAMVLLLWALPNTASFDPLHVILLSVAAWIGGFVSPAPAGVGIREIGLSLMMGSGLGAAIVVASITQRVMEISLEGLLWVAARLVRPKKD